MNPDGYNPVFDIIIIITLLFHFRDSVNTSQKDKTEIKGRYTKHKIHLLQNLIKELLKRDVLVKGATRR